jgi:hypothetical protein
MEAILRGFYALAPAKQISEIKGQRSERLIKGPAYTRKLLPLSQQSGTKVGAPRSFTDWPTFRSNAYRSGSTDADVGKEMKLSWNVNISKKISPPVIAEGHVYVASYDMHKVVCLDEKAGAVLWEYVTGGPIDSPPTIYRGRVYFGSSDGYLYSVTTDRGELAWRFRAAPEERRIMCRGFLESPWPVHGSVLVKDDIIYCTAGRSSFLDSGIFLYGVNATTGQVVYQASLKGPEVDLNTHKDLAYNMEGWLSEVLTADDNYIYMRNAQFTHDLKKVETPLRTDASGGYGATKMGMHILSTAGMLDDTFFDRSFWMHAARWPGFYHANDTSKAGQVLVADKHTTYAARNHFKRNIHSTFFFAGTDGIQLFADDNNNEPYMDEQNAKKNKHTSYRRKKPSKWAVMIPVYVRAMVKTKDILFVGGSEDKFDEKNPFALFEGNTPGLIWAVSPSDGKKLSSLSCKSQPVFNGMAATKGKMFVSQQNGSLSCFEN